MSTFKLFESAMRNARYPTMDAARKQIRENSMMADYVLDMLVERRVVEVNDQGQVIGLPVQVAERKSGGRKNMSAQWGATWPARDTVLRVIGDGAESLSEIRAELHAAGENPNHWSLLHALWNLKAHKEIVIEGSSPKTYRLAAAVPAAAPSVVAPPEKQKRKSPEMVARERMTRPYTIEKWVDELNRAWRETGTDGSVSITDPSALKAALKKWDDEDANTKPIDIDE